GWRLRRETTGRLNRPRMECLVPPLLRYFRTKVYSPDGSDCLNDVARPFSRVNVNIMSGNSFVRNRFGCQGMRPWNVPPGDLMASVLSGRSTTSTVPPLGVR